jgi:transcriptional regulator with XRE-family HTH domain
MNISKNIIAIREAKRIKQIEIANALGIEQSNYARLEKRDVEMSIKQLSDIAVALGVTIDDILHYGEEKPQIVDNDKVKELEKDIKEIVNQWKDSVIKEKSIKLLLLETQLAQNTINETMVRLISAIVFEVEHTENYQEKGEFEIYLNMAYQLITDFAIKSNYFDDDNEFLEFLEKKKFLIDKTEKYLKEGNIKKNIKNLINNIFKILLKKNKKN